MCNTLLWYENVALLDGATPLFLSTCNKFIHIRKIHKLVGLCNIKFISVTLSLVQIR